MLRSIFLSLLMCLLFFPSSLLAHGLMESPPSRNWLCGAVTKPDQVANGTAEYPICGEAFANDFNGGYSFMSVLTHDVGRAGVSPLPPHVCGFGSETWQGGVTPWDTPIDWPTNSMSPGRNEIVWNISWGPHFDDTEEFRYWITKPGFQYQVGVPLQWSDFEDQAFCVLTYDDANPTANPDVISDKAATQFRTFCDVPDRSGRHVIYGEWGRNFFTFERFHGCIDAVFDGTPNPVNANFTNSPSGTEVVGAATVALDGTGSVGTGLSYQWGVSAPDASLYSLSNPTGATTDLTFAAPTASSDVTVSLTVSDGTNTDTETRVFRHLTEAPAGFELLGTLTPQARTLSVGDQVQIRTVSSTGQDTYYPATPLTITAAYTAADSWPAFLANAINGPSSDIAIGVLDASGNTVTPVTDATANNIYARAGADVTSAFLNVTSPSSSCVFVVENEWNTGFTAKIRITNEGTTPIDGWQVGWELTDGSTVTNSWSATFSGTNPYTASNLSWNATIAPGATVEFGFNGAKGGPSLVVPVVTGSICQ